jgi:TolB-like protein/DNA-binding SARP family transcriptional activator
VEIKLTLFGGVAARRPDGGIIEFPTRKAEALLAYLAGRAGEAQPRDRLTGLLWSERPDVQARHSLSQTLSSIRRALNGAASFLIVDRDTVTLRACAADIDAAAFKRLAASDSAEDLQAAAELYRGPFLDGFKLREPAFEEWLQQERAQLYELAISVLLRLARCRSGAGDPESAASALNRALALDPLAEEAHRQLIRLHLDQGAYNTAIRRYRQCAEILKRELNTVPEPVTTELYREALRQLERDEHPRAELLALVPADGEPAASQPGGNGHGLWARPAVAVFPFENLSEDPEQAYLADGITEDIITALSCWRRFPVIARNSTAFYRAKLGDAARAAQELGARYFLQGSMRRAGGMFCISAQLVDSYLGTQLWSQRYDRDCSDFFAVQDEITSSIVQSIEPQLNRAELQRTLRKRSDNLDSWDYTQRALARLHGAFQHQHDYAGADAAEARNLLRKAIELDPSSSYAHALLALSHFHDALAGWTKNPPRVLAATLNAARRAVELDDDDWLSHALLGIALLWTSRQYDRAQHEVERAIALNPSAVIAHQFSGCVAVFAGRPREARAHLETVLQLDPRYQSRSLILADLSLARLLLDDVEGAVADAREAIRFEPGSVRAHHRLVAALGHRGPKAEAQEALRTLLQLQPDFSDAYVRSTYPFRLPQHMAVFAEGFQRAGWNGRIALEETG